MNTKNLEEFINEYKKGVPLAEIGEKYGIAVQGSMNLATALKKMGVITKEEQAERTKIMQKGRKKRN